MANQPPIGSQGGQYPSHHGGAGGSNLEQTAGRGDITRASTPAITRALTGDGREVGVADGATVVVTPLTALPAAPSATTTSSAQDEGAVAAASAEAAAARSGALTRWHPGRRRRMLHRKLQLLLLQLQSLKVLC
jgi:hypothetical protein